MTTYTMPPEPDHDTLWDKDGNQWEPENGQWRNKVNNTHYWWSLLLNYGPLYDHPPLNKGDTITDLTQEHERVPEGSVLHTTWTVTIPYTTVCSMHVLRTGGAWWYGDGTEMNPTPTIDNLPRGPYTVTRIGWPRKGQPLIPVPEADK